MINFSGTFAALRLLTNPSLCMPHATVPTFNDIPIPISKAFESPSREKPPDIRAVILDKDNCFAAPRTDTVYPDYEVCLILYLQSTTALHSPPLLHFSIP
jgi:phosphatidylglycerophosphatase GEP4